MKKIRWILMLAAAALALPAQQWSQPVREVEKPDKQAHAVALGDCGFGAGSGLGLQGCSYTVPAGKRFVIETVSYTTPNGESQYTPTIHVKLLTVMGGVSLRTIYRAQLMGGSPGYAPDYGFTQTVRLYADPGTSVKLLRSRQYPSGASLEFAQGALYLSGYLIDVP